MSYDIKKEAQMLEANPIYVAEQLHNIIKIMINRISFETRQDAFKNISNRVENFNVFEISNKKAPGGAAIGVSLGLIKNILNGKDSYFINVVLSELTRRL